MGQVMNRVMNELGESVEGKVVQEIVRKKLS